MRAGSSSKPRRSSLESSTPPLDPFRGYANAIRDELPDAVAVLDAFHVVQLGIAGVDAVRRRVQQDTSGTVATRMIRSTRSVACCGTASSTPPSGSARIDFMTASGEIS